MGDNIPNDEELAKAANEWLRTSDLENLTTKNLITQMENLFKCDLSSKKDIFLDILNTFFLNSIENQSFFSEENDTSDNKKKGKGGFCKVVQLSTALSEFLDGEISMPRTEVTKRIWDYIKKNQLQNPKDRREIICDAKFKKLFNRNTVGMFKMAKYLSEMMKSVDELQSSKPSTPITKQPVKKTSSVSKNKIKPSKSQTKTKKLTKKATEKMKIKAEERKITLEKMRSDGKGLHKICNIKPPLSEFLGLDQTSRPQVVSKLWAYIKEHELQNPDDKREIIFDASLRNIFETDKATMFSINKLISKFISS